jgi:hypothetical protein
MSPQLEQILQQIDRLPLVEQTKILRQLKQKIDSAHSNEPPVSNGHKLLTTFATKPRSISKDKKPVFLTCLPSLTNSREVPRSIRCG